MATFHLYKHPVQGLDAVKQGFTWPAFFFSNIWVFQKQMWILGFALLGIVILLAYAIGMLAREGSVDGVVIIVIVLIGVFVLIGFKADGWRKNNLKKRGFEYFGSVEAENPKSAIEAVPSSTETLDDRRSTTVESENETRITSTPAAGRARNGRVPQDALKLYKLGLTHFKGQAVPQNYTEAVRCFSKAAALGHSNAQNCLGVMYAKGQGVQQDYIMAYRWFALSLAQDNESAHDKIEKLLGVMTPEQIAEAQKAKNG